MTLTEVAAGTVSRVKVRTRTLSRLKLRVSEMMELIDLT